MAESMKMVGAPEPNPLESAPFLMSDDISASTKLAELPGSVMASAVELLQAGAGKIYLWDDAREELRFSIGYGDVAKSHLGLVLRPGEGMAGTVVQTGEPVLVNDYARWERKLPATAPYRPFLASLTAPMKSGGKTIGVLAINFDPRTRTFGQDDIRISTVFANIVVAQLSWR